jgi:protein SCO1/2
MKRFLSVIVAALVVAPLSARQANPLAVPAAGVPANAQLAILKDVRIDQHLDGQVPLDAPFVDENGRDVTLATYVNGQRPVVLALVYYDCPMLCTLLLNGLTGSLETLSFTAGRDFDVVAVSFNPGETPALAANAKATMVRRYNRPGADAGLHFLTGRPESIQRLTEAVGFHYAYDPAINQFAHAAALTILTPSGHISRYLFGVEFAPRDLRLSLVEATSGKIGNVLDQALLYCYHYDPSSGKYGLVIMSVVRLGGVLTVIAIGASIFLTLRRDRRQANAVAEAAAGTR